MSHLAQPDGALCCWDDRPSDRDADAAAVELDAYLDLRSSVLATAVERTWETQVAMAPAPAPAPGPGGGANHCRAASSASLLHRRSKFALIPLAIAIAALDTAGCSHVSHEPGGRELDAVLASVAAGTSMHRFAQDTARRLYQGAGVAANELFSDPGECDGRLGI